ncbi:MAG: hypothetical protein KA003_17325 [Caldilineaceae bacterium]|nr:hypothetical protein [Caldilineaceae bacterium]
MSPSTHFESHEQHFDTVNPEVRARLIQIQTVVEGLVPGSTRCISYNMPAFKLDGKTFFYFAAFKKHIGVYPPVSSDPALIQELAPYLGPKGNLSFPLNHPLPVELIGRIAIALAKQYAYSV